MNSPFNYYTRKNKKGEKVYYIRFFDPDTGERLSGLSSRKHTKAEAFKWAYDRLENGEYKPRKDLTFLNFTKEMFIWDKCTYIEYLRTKNQRFSRTHADTQRIILEKHLIPYFGKYKLKNISVELIESFLSNLSNNGYATTSISNYYNTLSALSVRFPFSIYDE